MVDIGIYHYKFESTDNGLTWTANLVSKKIQFISGTGKIIFVKTAANGGDNANDGLTWATAKATLAGANNAAESGDVVFMQSGKYYVDTYRTAGVENSRSFIIKNGVSVYGGFEGTEYNPDERIMTETQETLDNPYGLYSYARAIPTNPTILSGEITGDLPINGSISRGNRLTGASASNCSSMVVYHTGTSTVLINGCIIMGGFGTTVAIPINSTSGTLKLIYCEVRDCSVPLGLYRNISGTTITLSKIQHLTGTVTAGSTFDTTIVNCDAFGVSGAGATCALVNSGGSMNHCRIIGCRTNYIKGSQGGGIYNTIIESCIFSAAVYNTSTLFINFVIKNSTMSSFVQTLGAIKMIAGKIVNNTFTNALVISTNSDYVANLLIAHNYVTNGAVVLSGTPVGYVVTNLTVINNLGVTHAGIVNVPVINSVAWGNKIDGLKENFYSDGTYYPTNSAFEDEIVTGTANVSISANNQGDATSPYFKQVAAVAGNTELPFNYDIDNGSYLIDKGDNNYPSNGDGSLYDCKGAERKVDTVDIGAYENQKL